MHSPDKQAQITVQEGRTLTWCPGANLRHTTARCRMSMTEQPDGLRKRTRGRYSVAVAFTVSNQKMRSAIVRRCGQ